MHTRVHAHTHRDLFAGESATRREQSVNWRGRQMVLSARARLVTNTVLSPEWKNLRVSSPGQQEKSILHCTEELDSEVSSSLAFLFQLKVISFPFSSLISGKTL